MYTPSLVIDQVAEPGGVNNRQGDASALLIELCSLVNGSPSVDRQGVAQARDAPTVRGLILTPSSTWAEFGSSLSL